MITFDLFINGEKKVTSANEHGVMSLTIDKLSKVNNEKIIIRLGAFEEETKRHIDWINESLKEGDEVKLLITRSKEVIEVSPPMQYRVESHVDELVLKSKLKSYEVLKRELQEKGLI